MCGFLCCIFNTHFYTHSLLHRTHISQHRTVLILCYELVINIFVWLDMLLGLITLYYTIYYTIYTILYYIRLYLVIISSDIPLDFYDSIQVVPKKYLMYFLAGINTKQFWNIPKEKYFAPLRIMNLSIKSFVNSSAHVALTSFDSSFNSFLFDVTSFSLSSKSVLFTKLVIPSLVAKFACFNLKAKISAVNLLNSGVVVYL